MRGDARNPLHNQRPHSILLGKATRLVSLQEQKQIKRKITKHTKLKESVFNLHLNCIKSTEQQD